MIGRGWGSQTRGKRVGRWGVAKGGGDLGPEQFGRHGEKRERATRAARSDPERVRAAPAVPAICPRRSHTWAKWKATGFQLTIGTGFPLAE
jgi:hypothetical protein